MSWSSVRKRLEEEFLAPSLRGRLTYFITRYHHAHDEAGRVAIRFDGEEVMKADYFNKYTGQYSRFYDMYEENGHENFAECWRRAVIEAENAGEFDQHGFYSACNEFFSQSIDESLASERMIVRTLAVLDRRTGKRRLKKLLAEANESEPIFRMMLLIRCQAEGITEDINMIEYRDTHDFTPSQLERLFLSVEWSSGHYPDKLAAAMKNFSTVYSAWDGDVLVGMICAMDDGVMNAYIHYLLVDPEHQGQQIGRKLVSMAKEHYKDYLRIAVIGYDKEIHFYENCGFVKSEESSPLFITSLWT